MADEQLTPQVIPNTPLPLLNSDTAGSVSSGGSENGLSPATIPNAPIKDAPIASDVISISIDTANRRILGEYGFGQVGAFKVGNFQPGVSGDVRISPSGIIGRDNTGLERFILDDNGELILQNTSGRALFDASGIVSTTNFLSNEVFNGSAGLSTNSSSFVDVAGSTLLSITTTRNLNVLFFMMIYGYNDAAISSNATANLEAIIYDSFSTNSIINALVMGNTTTYTPNGLSFSMSVSSQMISRTGIITVTPGSHTYKLQYKAKGGGLAVLDAWDIGYAILGS